MTTVESLAPAPCAVVPVRAWHCLTLLMILAVAAGLRVYHLSADSLWLDEFYSLESTAGHCYGDLHLPRNQVIDPPPRLSGLGDAIPVHALWTSFAEDQHPPLYFMLLRIWREAFGSSDAAIRSLSVAASVAAVALLFDVGRLLFSPGVALWACGLMAVAQLPIRYAQEARSYALLTAFLLAAASAVVRIERFGLSRARGAALFLSLLAVVLTHYFGVAGCLALGVYVLIRFRGPVRRRTLAVMAAAAFAYCVIWLPFALRQFHGYAFNNDWLWDMADGRLSRWSRRLAYAPIRFFADASRRSGPIKMLTAVMLVLPVLCLRRVPALLLPTLWFLTWVGLLAGLDLARSTRQLEYPRYLLGAAPAVYLIAAALLSDRRGWLRHVLPMSLAFYCVISLPWTYEQTKEEYRHLGEYAGRMFGVHDLALYRKGSGPSDALVGILCVAVDHSAPHVATPTVVMTEPLTGDLLDRARSAEQVWLVNIGESPDEIGRLMPGFRIADHRFFLGIGQVYRLVSDVAATTSSPAPAAGTGTSSTPTTRGT